MPETGQRDINSPSSNSDSWWDNIYKREYEEMVKTSHSYQREWDWL